MLVLPHIKNISEKISSSIDKNEYLTGHRILNKLTGFIKRHKDVNEFETNNNIVYKIFVIIVMPLMLDKQRDN